MQGVRAVMLWRSFRDVECTFHLQQGFDAGMTTAEAYLARLPKAGGRPRHDTF